MSEIKLTSIEGNSQMLDGGAMFGNAPRVMWEKWVPPDKEGRIPLACRSLLVEIDQTKILLEAGVGAFFEPKLAQRFGIQQPETHLLLQNLNELDLQEEDIDYVILSHLHFDHAGGLMPSYNNLTSNPGLHFPNAKYIVGKLAWERAQNPHSRDRASFIPDMIQRLKDSQRLIIVDTPTLPELFGEHVEFFLSHGHTPGQLLTRIKNNKQNIIFLGDLVPGAPWVNLPISMGYDRFPELIIDEKKKLYESMDQKNTLLFFTHDANYASAKLSKNEKGRWVATDLKTNLIKFEL
ncbi:MAG: MBL fold metallo-hydrolase [Bdellovibrionaceae bacterium]|jgi:glyoxylase-like metal-dependent hydrolase (beta-lactamase superfamily II)|nr:MBL fold metallo-hydrolase [Pseudobdellovibrionaceae bacterium]